MKLPALRRTPVEWVDLYTRQTLLGLLWLTVLVVLLGATPVAGANPTAMAALVGVAVALLAAGTWALRAVAQAWPEDHGPPRGPIVTVYAVAVISVGVCAALPEDPREAGLTMVWVTLVWALSGLRDRRHLLILLVALCVGVQVAIGSIASTAAVLASAVFVGLTVHLSLWLLEVVRRLDRSRDTEAALAVAEERLRFSRDVHDVLGRHLSTIAVRSELAAALARRGDPTAADTMLEVRASAHDALREARELARGYRVSDLDRELEGARSLLAAAGIATDVDMADLPLRWHEPAAWVVREAVTNVLRHSTATTVRIEWDDGVLTVANDRSDSLGDGAGGAYGFGIIGLTERLAPLGAVVSTTLREGTWTLAVTMPDDRVGVSSSAQGARP